MKKFVLCILVSCMLLSLCACGKSTEVKVAEHFISEIGEVTVGSLDAIESAELMYDGLSESDKKKVENYDALLAAREAFDELTAGLAKNDAKTALESLNLAASAIIIISEQWTIGTRFTDDEFSSLDNIFSSNMDEGLDMVNSIEETYGRKEYTSMLKNYYAAIRRLTNFLNQSAAETGDISEAIEGYIDEIVDYQEDLNAMLQ